MLSVGALLFLGVGARAACGSRETAGAETLVGRVWVDHVPSKPNEHVEWFVVLPQEQGVFSRASQFDGSFSVFLWSAPKNGELSIEFPQDGSRHTVRYTAEPCKEGGFDYCLTLTGAPRGVQRYGSKRGWELDVDSPAEVQAALRDLDLGP
jgi:hypothetical protein